MTVLVDQLARLCGLRDRSALLVAVLFAMRGELLPLGLSVLRPIGKGDYARWLTLARLDADDTLPYIEPEWIDIDRLAPLASEPERLACLQQGLPVQAAGSPCRYFVPVQPELDVAAVLEVRTPQPLTPAQRQLIAGLDRLHRNLCSLLDENERDPMTGLLNRKTFDETIARMVLEWFDTDEAGVCSALPSQRLAFSASELERRHRTRRQGCWLGIIDLDHFKSVNDRFGHLIGDEVILLLARMLKDTFRGQDKVYRFGGEEFVVLLRCHDEADALHAFERLRQAVRAHEFPQVGHITVSVGFTALGLDDTPTDAFARADDAVYWVKQHGRNHAASHESLVRDRCIALGDKAGGVDFF
ncbi:diguanylate cyclase (GGDEF)-like protein [Sphaerotilus hippei]|uniref:diguanylate cyclase n=1 Tax=Sphaerotilus hippei TaxID=744406 RepID=A0A318GXR6_9BURK|nr:diguanylate cyclase (GGDEF)-like protein [Sphaerotilus hippei]